MNIQGTTGDDRLVAGDDYDSINFSQGGRDTVSAGAGDDTLVAGGALNYPDRIDGGDGYDYLRLDGDYSGGLTLSGRTLTNVEEIDLGPGHDYALTLQGVTSSAEWGSGLSVILDPWGEDVLVLDASAMTVGVGVSSAGGADSLIGGSGNDGFQTGFGDDTCLSGAGSDSIRLGSGTVRAEGGEGDDTIDAGASFGARDTIVGGAGHDILRLEGEYAGRILLGGESGGFEVVDLGFTGGTDLYRLKLTNAFAAPTETDDTLVIGSPGGFTSVIFDGSAERDMKLSIGTEDGNDWLVGGRLDDTFHLDGGSDTVSGGAGDDVFDFYINPALDTSDRLDGGRGFDVVDMQGDPHVVLDADTVRNIELIRYRGVDSSVTLNDGNVAAGARLTIDAAEGLNNLIDGSAETDGQLELLGGGWGDTLTGGAGADRLVGGDQSFFGADVLSGGAGADQFVWRYLIDMHSGGDDPADLITDLADEDTIILKGVDADATRDGDQRFALVDHFTGDAGQMTLTWDREARVTHLRIDVDGDGAADGQIDLRGDHRDFDNFLL